MTFAVIDFVFFAVLAIFVIGAGIRGFVDELFSKLAFIVALLSAFFFHSLLVPFFAQYINQQFVCIIVSFLSVFVCAFLAVKVLQLILGNIFNLPIFRGLNVALGILLGALEGFLVVGFILLVVYSQPFFSPESLLEKSVFVKFFEPYFSALFRQLPFKIDNMFVFIPIGGAELYV